MDQFWKKTIMWPIIVQKNTWKEWQQARTHTHTLTPEKEKVQMGRVWVGKTKCCSCTTYMAQSQYTDVLISQGIGMVVGVDENWARQLNKFTKSKKESQSGSGTLQILQLEK